MQIEYTDHAMIVRKDTSGGLPLGAMEGLTKMAEAQGFDLIDPGAGSALKAILVVTNAEHKDALHAEIKKRAHQEAEGDPSLRTQGARILTEWLRGVDTGTSSLTIAEVLSGRPGLWGSFGPSPPIDPDDLGRCIRLLDLMEGWRERLPEVAAAVPTFGPLVEHWDELEALYREEEPTGKAPKCYARMQELHESPGGYREGC